MHRRPLLDALEAYALRYPDEQAVAARIRGLVAGHADCFLRSCLPGHVTGSAWVASHDFRHCLLVHHRKLDRWLQPGGHADGESDVAAVALREAREESGLDALELAPHVDELGRLLPLDIDVHVIPARYDAAGELLEPAHEHHDVRYLVWGDAGWAPQASVESHDARWFACAELPTVTRERSVLRMLEKAERWRSSRPA